MVWQRKWNTYTERLPNMLYFQKKKKRGKGLWVDHEHVKNDYIEDIGWNRLLRG